MRGSVRGEWRKPVPYRDTQGGKELPEIPRRREGKRGRIARSIGHNLHDRLLKYEDSVLRFMSDPDVSFTNNTGEQKIRMSKVEIKVSGCFCDRTLRTRPVPNIKISRFHESTWIQSTRHNPDRACRKCR